MAGEIGVSRGVSSRVSREETEQEPARRKKGRSPGPYLVRSGSVYLFQIRLPVELGGGRGSRPIRISLGACPARKARRLADLLAAEARACFERMLTRRMGDRDDDNRKDDGTATDAPYYLDPDYLEAVIETKGALRMALQVVSNPVPPMTPEDEVRAQGWKGLVELGRELAKGEGGNQLVRENVDVLRQRYADKLMSTVAPRPEGETAEPPKTFRPQSMLQPVAQIAPDPVGDGFPPVEPEKGAGVPDHGHDNYNGDDDDDEADKDRRFVPRKESGLPKFSTVAKSYFKSWEEKSGKENKDIRSARRRADLFMELIGDHPIDTYTGADLKAYVRLLKYWPGNNNERSKDMGAREIIEANNDLHLKPLSMSSLKNSYIGVVRTIMAEGAVDYDIRNPFEKVRLRYPATARPAKPSQPLSAAAISSIFATGVESGFLDEAMLPLLGHLTGRRLGLLIHLTGNDVREKYPGVWVAETDGIVKVDGTWTRVPYKTDTSTGFFLLHSFLKGIGFVDWAIEQGERFLFPQIMKLENPSKSASSYMQRLYRRAGIKSGTREVFHSLRAGNIDDMRDAKVDPRDRRLQAGHTVGDDEHDNYGFKSISEIRAREMVRLPLNSDIDFSVFEGLDFKKMARKTRTKGKRRD